MLKISVPHIAQKCTKTGCHLLVHWAHQRWTNWKENFRIYKPLLIRIIDLVLSPFLPRCRRLNSQIDYYEWRMLMFSFLCSTYRFDLSISIATYGGCFLLLLSYFTFRHYVMDTMRVGGKIRMWNIPKSSVTTHRACMCVRIIHTYTHILLTHKL